MDQHKDESRIVTENSARQDDDEAVARVDELKKSMEAKMVLRISNLNPERPDAGFLRTLDSSIRRNTAVIKKLKQINEEQRESLMDELRSINMSKFVSEAVTAICDAKLRTSDIQAAVNICSLLHQRYEDFSFTLVQGLMKVFFSGKSGDDLEIDRNAKAMKKRSTLKLLLELFFVGIINDAGIFVSIIKDLANVENLKDRDATQMNLSLLTSFARQGRIFLGLPPSGHEIYEEIYKDLIVTPEQKKAFKKGFHSYYDAAVEVLLCEHSTLRQMERENAKALNSKGELSDDSVSSYEKLRKSYDQLYRGISSLAEALNMQPPVMPEDNHTTRLTSGDDSSPSLSGRDNSGAESIWDDEDTRSFYECLPDLRSFVPAVLLGETEPKAIEQSAKTQDQLPDAADSEKTEDNTEMVAEGAGPNTTQDDKIVDQGSEKGKEKEKDKGHEREKRKFKETDRKGENEKERLKGYDGTHLDGLLQRLPGCVSRDLIDQLTVEFCYLNSKSNRKRLVRALFNVPRTSLELLPYYSRMVATLSSCLKDISSSLLSMLEDEFNFLINKKDQMNIETKIRNIRFIGELCKFRVAPASLIFSFLKACLDDFSHHNIDVACNLLETCGRFLYRSPETTVRMANMLEILMRLRNVKNLDPRHITLVENAYYICKPPERSARISKARPPLHLYIRKLLFSVLDKTTIEHVLRQLRKLPWNDCESYLLKCFMKVHKGKYGQIHLIASLTAGLSRYHEDFSISVVDEVLEEIRTGLELNDYGTQQRRLAHTRLLGELYNYEQLDSSVIFDTLYLILIFGHGTPEEDTMDPPEDCFRIRMVITLLETCGHYFDKGSSKRKLNRFLIYFQRYILGKGPLPLDIEFDLQDLFADLRPKMTRYSSIEDVDAALTELEEHQQSNSFNNVSSDLSLGHEKPLAGHAYASASENGHGFGNFTEGNDLPEEAEGEIDTDSGSAVDDVEGNGEEELDGSHDADEGDTEDDDGDVVGPASDEEDETHTGQTVVKGDSQEEVHVRQSVFKVDPQEEADFDKELRALMQESLDSRKLELRSRPTPNMMIPMHISDGSPKDQFSRSAQGDTGDDALVEKSGDGSSVAVKVLVKRGSKQQTKEMYIPSDSLLVQSAKEKEAAELEEKQDIKRIVLQYNDREEEELNAMVHGSNWSHAGAVRVGGRSMGDGGVGRPLGQRSRFHNYPTGGGHYYRRK